MAEITEIKDGVLTVTKTPEVVSTVETLTRKDVIGKRAEAQTIVDHLVFDAAKLQLDITTAQAKVAKLDAYLADIDKTIVLK